MNNPRSPLLSPPSPDKEVIDFTSSPKKDSPILQLATEAEVEKTKEDPC